MRAASNIMCNLSEDIEERGLINGHEEGISALIGMARDFWLSYETIIQQLITRFNLSEE